MDIPVICFAGWSGSGKTTLVTRLIPRLVRLGYKITVVKHDVHGESHDDTGKDSRRFRETGAEQCILCSTTPDINEDNVLADAFSKVNSGINLIIAEGFKRSSLKKIAVCRSENGKGLPGKTENFMAIATDMDLGSVAVPTFGLDDLEGLTEFMVQNMEDFTHFNDQGRARMVNVEEKPVTTRTATASAKVLVSPETFALIKTGGMKKGDVLTVAQIAGIMGAKRTPDIIPMCHPIVLGGIDLSLTLDEREHAVNIEATVSCDGKTGVEMEALTAAATAALTVYDMCKAVQKDMEITELHLVKKTGGVHGDFIRSDDK